MRVAVIRQLSRVAGRLLAECSKDTRGAMKLTREALELDVRFDKYASFINGTVQSIVDSNTLADATTHVTRHWRDLAKRDAINSEVLLCGVASVVKWSCEQMLGTRGVSASARDEAASLDDSESRSRLLPNRSPERALVVLNGGFSELLISQARAAEARWQAGHQPSRDASSDNGDLVTFRVTEDFSFRGPDVTRRFTLRRADFTQAYIAATFEYAARVYADRVRTGQA